jgi:hypothetical protein
MREILPGRLWLGNAGDGRDPERLLRTGVVAVVNLAAEEPSPVLPAVWSIAASHSWTARLTTRLFYGWQSKRSCPC